MLNLTQMIWVAKWLSCLSLKGLKWVCTDIKNILSMSTTNRRISVAPKSKTEQDWTKLSTLRGHPGSNQMLLNAAIYWQMSLHATYRESAIMGKRYYYDFCLQVFILYFLDDDKKLKEEADIGHKQYNMHYVLKNAAQE